MKKTYKLSIFLIHKRFETYESCIRNDSKYYYNSYPLKNILGIDGIIFIANTKKRSSKWLGLLQQGADKTLPELYNASNKAVLFIREGGRIIAFTFGYGQYLLNPSSIVRNFGLKTSLNIIKSDKLRSMDKAKLDELTIQTRIQSSITTDRSSFNIDMIGDLLRSITGESTDDNLGNIVTGTDAIYLSPKVDFSDLKPTIKKLLEYYKLDKYKESFDWIDNIEHEKDPSLIKNLNEDLINALKNKELDNISMAPPSIIDWTSFVGIRFSPNGNLYSDFNIQNYYDYKDDLDNLTPERLQASNLYIEDETNISRYEPVSRCLNFQTELNGNLYVKTLGRWYRISKIFSDQIMEEVSLIKESDSVFIDCQKNWTERVYNEELAHSNNEFTLFDTKLLKCESARTFIEACDVLTKNRELIHIKPKNSSSTLSHLFSQGRISAIALNSDKVYRKEMRKIIRSNGDFSSEIIPLNKINNSDFTVTYATITKGEATMVEKLPFFSLINLRQSAQYLTEHGFEVRIKKIKRLDN